jgi:hypothetical protein
VAPESNQQRVPSALIRTESRRSRKGTRDSLGLRLRTSGPTLWLTGALLLCAITGCHKHKASTGIESVLPRDARMVAVSPDLGKVGDALTRLQKMKLASFAAQLQGLPSAEAWIGATMGQFGVDLRSRDSMAAAGLAPEKGAAVVETAGGADYLVLGTKDAGKLEAKLRQLARDRLGASDAHEENGVTTLSRAGTGVVSFTRAGDYELIGPASLAPTFDRRTLGALQPLSSDDRLAQALEKLPMDRLSWTYFPSGGTFLGATLPEATALASSLHDDALAVDAAIPLPSITPLAAALAKIDGKDLTGQLPPDATFALSFNANASDWSAIWPHLAGAHLERMFRSTGIDIDHEVLGNLKPGAFVSIALAPTAQLGAGVPTLDVRRTNPFRYVQLAAAGQVKDPAAADKTLAALANAAPKFGGWAHPEQVANVAAYVSGYAQGESTDFARVGDQVVAAAPRARFEQAISLAQKPAKSPFGGALQHELTDEAIGAVIDLDQLRSSIRALPSSAWGVGGFAMKATAMRWLDATDELEAITFGVHSEGGTARVHLELRFAR